MALRCRSSALSIPNEFSLQVPQKAAAAAEEGGRKLTYSEVAAMAKSRAATQATPEQPKEGTKSGLRNSGGHLAAAFHLQATLVPLLRLVKSLPQHNFSSDKLVINEQHKQLNLVITKYLTFITSLP